MWTKYFKLVKVRPGRIITPSHGELDFSRDNIPVETCKQLFEADFPYLEITEEGKKEFYGIVPEAEPVMVPDLNKEDAIELMEAFDPVFEPLPDADENPDELKESVPIRNKYTKKEKSLE